MTAREEAPDEVASPTGEEEEPGVSESGHNEDRPSGSFLREMSNVGPVGEADVTRSAWLGGPIRRLGRAYFHALFKSLARRHAAAGGAPSGAELSFGLRSPPCCTTFVSCSYCGR
jgi:hypothetical protein